MNLRFDPSIPDLSILYAIVSVNKLFYTIHYTIFCGIYARVYARKNKILLMKKLQLQQFFILIK
jgi:hypothetical protein